MTRTHQNRDEFRIQSDSTTAYGENEDSINDTDGVVHY